MYLTLERAQTQLHQKAFSRKVKNFSHDDSGDASCQALTLNRTSSLQCHGNVCQLSVEAQTERHTASNWRESEPATCKMQSQSQTH